MTMYPKHIARKAYKYVEDKWFVRIIYENAPTVRVMDALIGSECKYCMAVRAMLIGAGVALWNIYGAVLVALAIICAIAERFLGDQHGM